MTTQYKIAAKEVISDSTYTVLYTVPTGKQFISTTLNICNKDSADPAVVSVGIIKEGETVSNVCEILADFEIPVGEYETLKPGMTLSAGDVVYAKSNGKDASFVLFGAEID